MRRKKQVMSKPSQNQILDPTSSLNKYFLCVCGKKYVLKLSLKRHVLNCDGTNQNPVCRWCKLEFTNKANLATHAFHMHGDKSYRNKSGPGAGNGAFKCEACGSAFKERWQLRLHIRRYHFNLWASIPHYEAKKINQTWFEKVSNTNLLVEIKKTAPNTLLMKPSPPNATIKVSDAHKKIDLTSLYPTGQQTQKEQCKICLATYKKKDLKKHMDEKHYNNVKTKCNNCNRSFKRLYIYLQHVCHKARKKRGLKPSGVTEYGPIKITSVASLKPVEVD